MLGFGAAKQRRQAARDWHSLILSWARDPSLYQRGWAQDTLEGRFQIVTLVAALVLRRLRELGAPGRKLADSVYRDVFSGFDHALREEGVGDASIARKVRGLGEAFFGLARAIDRTMEDEDRPAAIAEVLDRNAVARPEDCLVLAGWLLDLAGRLEAAVPEALMAGRL